MFINKSRNKSGTTSVRVLEKRGRNNVLVKSMGSSRDEKEIERMVEQAKTFIKQRKGSLYNLFNPPENPSADEIISDISNNQISVVGPEAVFGKLFDHVGYGEVGGLFRPLVLSRLVSPGNKLKTVDYLWRYNGISYEIFEGNLSEKKTFVPLLKRAQERFGFGKPIVVADSGLLSRKNIATLVEDGYEYILGARIKNETAGVKERITGLGLKDGEAKSVATDDGLRIVVSFTEKRRKKDELNRIKGLKRLQDKVATGKVKKSHINNRGYNKYLRLKGEATVSIDMEAFEKDSAWDGLKGYVTNTSLPDEEVIANYHNLWFIERAFRMNKTDLQIRPMYHRLRNRIEGHICICLCAYVLQLETERMLKKAGSKITLERARELVKTMYAISYTKQGHTKPSKVMLRMDDEQTELVNIVSNWINRDFG